MLSRKTVLLEQSHSLLLNHVVLDRPILPATGYFDLVLEVAAEFDEVAQTSGTLPWKVSNAFWFSPLSVPGASLAVDIEWDGPAYRVVSGEPHARTVHASGVWERMESDSAPLSGRGALPYRLDRAGIYGAFTRSGIRYGDALRCLTAFVYGPEGGGGTLVRQQVGLGRTECFPDILDAAVQCALLWVRQMRPQAELCVPFSLREISVRGVPGATCRCELTLCAEAKDNRSYFSFDLQLLDESGSPLVEMKDLCVRPFRSGGGHADGGKDADANVPPARWIVASTFTAEPIEEPLRELCSRLQWDAQVQFAPYNQLFQELLDPQSLVSTNRRGANLFPIRLEDFQDRAADTAPELPTASRDAVLEGCERHALPNGMEIAHLNSYETRYLYDEIFVQRTYLKQGIVVEEGDVVIDIGANIGMFSMFVARHCKGVRLLACEPSPATYEVLRRNLALHAPGAVALPFGVADEDRDATFHFYPKSSVFSGFHVNDQEDRHALRQAMANEFAQRFGDGEDEALRQHLDAMVDARLQKEAYTCRLRSLSSLMREHQIDSIGLLKVDAEKCEWDILRSISPEEWQKIRQIVVELHDSEDGELSRRITALLRYNGF